MPYSSSRSVLFELFAQIWIKISADEGKNSNKKTWSTGWTREFTTTLTSWFHSKPVECDCLLVCALMKSLYNETTCEKQQPRAIQISNSSDNNIRVNQYKCRKFMMYVSVFICVWLYVFFTSSVHDLRHTSRRPESKKLIQYTQGWLKFSKIWSDESFYSFIWQYVSRRLFFPYFSRFFFFF